MYCLCTALFTPALVLPCAHTQLEEETYDSLDVFTFLGEPDHPNRPYPHFSKLAEAYGVPGLTAWTKQELLEGLGVMFSQPGPFLLEVVALAERPHIRYAREEGLLQEENVNLRNFVFLGAIPA
jgi:hypothetical protein